MVREGERVVITLGLTWRGRSCEAWVSPLDRVVFVRDATMTDVGKWDELVMQAELILDATGAVAVRPRGGDDAATRVPGLWEPEIAQRLGERLRDRYGTAPFVLLFRDENWLPLLELMAESPWRVRGVPGYDGSLAPFGLFEIDRIIVAHPGEPASKDWQGVFVLRDGRVAFVSAGCACDWGDSRSGTTARVAASLAAMAEYLVTVDEVDDGMHLPMHEIVALAARQSTVDASAESA